MVHVLAPLLILRALTCAIVRRFELRPAELPPAERAAIREAAVKRVLAALDSGPWQQELGTALLTHIVSEVGRASTFGLVERFSVCKSDQLNVWQQELGTAHSRHLQRRSTPPPSGGKVCSACEPVRAEAHPHLQQLCRVIDFYS